MVVVKSQYSIALCNPKGKKLVLDNWLGLTLSHFASEYLHASNLLCPDHTEQTDGIAAQTQVVRRGKGIPSAQIKDKTI